MVHNTLNPFPPMLPRKYDEDHALARKVVAVRAGTVLAGLSAIIVVATLSLLDSSSALLFVRNIIPSLVLLGASSGFLLWSEVQVQQAREKRVEARHLELPEGATSNPNWHMLFELSSSLKKLPFEKRMAYRAHWDQAMMAFEVLLLDSQQREARGIIEARLQIVNQAAWDHKDELRAAKKAVARARQEEAEVANKLKRGAAAEQAKLRELKKSEAREEAELRGRVLADLFATEVI